jgi:hypothetical protein
MGRDLPLMSYPDARGIAFSPPWSVQTEDGEVREYVDCWHFPSLNVGFTGILVAKHDGHVTPLGSALGLDDWLWGFRNGFQHDTYDIVITQAQDAERAVAALGDFAFRYPDVDAKPIEWFNEARLVRVLRKQPRVIRHQRLGLKIPLFRQMAEQAEVPFAYELRVTGCQDKNCVAGAARGLTSA